MKEQIQSLIEKGEIKEAINYAAKTIEAARLLQKQYNNLIKEFNLGLISYQDFTRRTAAISNTLLDLIPTNSVFSPGYMKVVKNNSSKFVGINDDIELVLVSKKKAKLISDPIAWRETENYYKEQGYVVQKSC